MAKPFVIEPHFRLQEWVAEEKGYFRESGLDYMFQELIQSTDGKEEWGTVGVDDNIIEASLQALVDSMEYRLMKK